MSIRYAPYIEGTIPAFDSYWLKVPFEMNRGVADGSIKAMVAKISELNNNPKTIKYVIWNRRDFTNPLRNEIEFDISELNGLNQGYYKIQIAYSDEINISNYNNLVYSSVGIGKHFVNRPNDSRNGDKYLYRFEYDDNGSGEFPYSYRFDTINKEFLFPYGKNNISFLTFLTNDNGYWYTTRTIKTINNYEIMNDSGAGEAESIEAIITLHSANSKISIVVDGPVPGLVLRSTDQTSWAPIGYITEQNAIVNGNGKTVYQFIDNNVETGIRYYYDYVNITLDAKNILTKVSERAYFTKNNPNIIIDYEDMSLVEKDKILCIKFNPKISSFKTTIQETKTDTIGGKYPVFYRNGTLGYKEFPINGLISYHMDENEDFMTKTELGLETEESIRTKTASGESAAALNIPTHNLVDYNIVAERKFRNAVLDWLNNGEVKLFKSPTEGMYLVRLMNISLSPEEKLGRMIYSFNATAYEVGEVNYENLVKYGFINKIEGVDYVIR